MLAVKGAALALRLTFLAGVHASGRQAYAAGMRDAFREIEREAYGVGCAGGSIADIEMYADRRARDVGPFARPAFRQEGESSGR